MHLQLAVCVFVHVCFIHVYLLDVVKSLFIALQSHNNRVLDEVLCKLHHILVIGGGKEDHLAIMSQMSFKFV